jgi:hypothetical protein
MSTADSADPIEARLARFEAQLEDLVAGALDAASPAVAGGTAPPAEPFYPNLESWVTERFAPMYAQYARVVGGELRWCARWWDHAEAISRLEPTVAGVGGSATGPGGWAWPAGTCSTSIPSWRCCAAPGGPSPGASRTTTSRNDPPGRTSPEWHLGPVGPEPFEARSPRQVPLDGCLEPLETH